MTATVMPHSWLGFKNMIKKNQDLRLAEKITENDNSRYIAGVSGTI